MASGRALRPLWALLLLIAIGLLMHSLRWGTTFIQSGGVRPPPTTHYRAESVTSLHESKRPNAPEHPLSTLAATIAPEDDKDSTQHQHSEGWAEYLLAPLIEESLETTPDEFCEKQIQATWSRAKSVLAPPLFAALEELRHRHKAVADGKPLDGQKYIVWSLSGGIGNRLLSLSSTLVAAILSQRVLLMKDWFTPLPRAGTKQEAVFLMKEAMPNALGQDQQRLEDLWKLFDFDSQGKSTRASNSDFVCPLLPMMSLTEFRLKYPDMFTPDGKEKNNGRSSDEHVMLDIRSRHDKKLFGWNRLLCTNMSGGAGSKDGLLFYPEKFVYIWTNQYYLPALFANPIHGPQLRSYFPVDKPGPYDTMVRLLMIPSLPVVKRLQDFFRKTHLSPKRFTSAQVRAFQVNAIAGLAEAFDRCMKADHAVDRIHPFFLASMHQPVREYFAKHYGPIAKTLAPPRHDQPTGQVEGDQEALADMLILSLSSELYLSHGSTFGTFSAAYGGIVPHVVAGRQVANKVCQSPDGKAKAALPKDGTFQPCFGSWYHYDHLAHRQKEIRCELMPIPEHVMSCR